MGLYERWTADDGTKITGHDWAGLMHFWLSNAEGLSNAAQNKIIEVWSPDAEDTTELQAIKTKYDGFATNVEKMEFLLRITHMVALAETGRVTKAQAKTMLGF